VLDADHSFSHRAHQRPAHGGGSAAARLPQPVWLYSDAFNEITNGSNPERVTDGFPDTVGWDPVTGLGSPNFNALLAAADLSSW
jgi:hypothetical protein